MRDKNLIYTYSDFFGKEKLEVTQKKEKKRILKQDFYNRLTELGLRKSNKHLQILDKLLKCDFKQKHMNIDTLHLIIEAKRNGNSYIASFGTKRRRLPEDVGEGQNRIEF